MMTIIIKGMVCHHCVEAVKRVLSSAGLTTIDVTLGKATIGENLDNDALKILDNLLENEGFSRIVDADSEIVERIKRAVIEHVRQPEECKLNLSACLERHIGISYDTISRVFSSHEGRTIEKYQIVQRIEWVKELLGYGQYTVSEIADMTGYSSTAHLSRQFKNITGLTTSQYLKSSMDRQSLNEV